VSSPGQRREMGRAGRQRLLERYSHITMAEGFVEVYRTMLEATPTKRSGNAVRK
jgi:hypothetical protein